MAFMPPLLSGCRNNGKAEEKNSQTELVEQKKPIFMKESFHKFKESMDGSISPQWLLSDSLSKYASIEEIEKLATTDKDPIMRLVAFRALLSKDPQQAVNLAISNIEDTTIVGATDGICGEQDRVSNIRLLMLQNHRERNQYGYSQWLYHNMPAKPEYETRLRQLYKQDPQALVTLAKYHREKERLEIIQLLSNTKNEDDRNYCDTLRAVLNAVANWPDASFIPFVQNVCQKIIMERQYTFGCEESAFRALIAYHSKWSYDMAEKALAKAKKDGDKFMVCWGFHKAFEHNPQPLFKPLITKYKN